MNAHARASARERDEHTNSDGFDNKNISFSIGLQCRRGERKANKMIKIYQVHNREIKIE